MDGFDKLFLFFIVGCIIKYACGYKKRRREKEKEIQKTELDRKNDIIKMQREYAYEFEREIHEKHKEIEFILQDEINFLGVKSLKKFYRDEKKKLYQELAILQNKLTIVQNSETPETWPLL